MSLDMPSPLIAPAELAQRLDDPDWVIVDTRHDLADRTWGRQSYEQMRIPGATFLSIEDDLCGPKNGRNGRHPLPEPERLADRLGQIGIGAATTVVVYDQGSAMYVGRLWWLLRWLGHEAVYVLDGGFAAWQAEGHPLEAGPAKSTRKPCVFPIRPTKVAWVEADAVLQAITDPEQRIVDARAPERYRGEVEPIDPVAGHIPGAINRPFAANLRQGRFKPAEELAAEWSQILAGRKPEQIIHQCGSGVSALANMIAMEHAGLTGSRLYPGSWSEWCADASRPIARGG
jgi:Rhodanese-related sulfurtransferase